MARRPSKNRFFCPLAILAGSGQFLAQILNRTPMHAMPKLVLTGLFSILFLMKLSAQCTTGDCKNGKGTYVFPSGAKYVGDFRNGECHGIGVCYYTDGSKYSGEWRDRFPEGKGTKTYSDGTKRTGNWKKGKPVDEKGNLLEDYIAKKKEEAADDGTNIQSGCIEGNCESGNGKLAYPDGSKYEGQFLNKKPDGWGTFFFANGEKFVGNFKEGYPHGAGTIFHLDSTKTVGRWKQGEFVGVNFSENGEHGCVEGNCESGKGTYIYREGAAKYVGQFKDGAANGSGTCTYSNGDRYIGEWANGSFNGKGTLYLHDGKQVDGYWEDGNYLGKEKPESAVGGELAEKKEESASEKAEKEKEKADFTQKTKVYAVVVGVSAYNHMPVLRYTDDDAYRFYAFLKSVEGGALPDEQVKVMIDEEATRENILSTLSETFDMAGPNDLVLLYFSGHGLKGSFLPIDFDGFNNKITHEELTEIFSKCKAKYKLLIADACHSGSIFAMRGEGEDNEAIASYYQTLAKSVSGTALLMSSKGEETSLESSGLRQGVFSHFLIRGLKGEADGNGDKIISVQELYDYVYNNVRAYTGNRQSPILKGTYDPAMTVGVVRK